MRSLLLTIDHLHAMLPQEMHQIGQGYLGCIADAGKHRFTVKHLADAHAISATDQFAIEPDFCRVRKAGAMQAAIAIDDIHGNPGAGTIAAWSCTGAHDVAKG